MEPLPSFWPHRGIALGAFVWFGKRALPQDVLCSPSTPERQSLFESHRQRRWLTCWSYAEGLIAKQEFEPRVTRMRTQLQHLEVQVAHLKAEGEVEEELRLILGRLETFAAKVHDGLQQADFQMRQEIIRSLVKRVEVDQQHIRIVFRLSPTSSPPASDNASHHWQDSGK